MYPYKTKNPKRRIACALSHFLLWKKCTEIKEPILILEHDAEFIRKFNPEYILNSSYSAIGINDPRGATRLDRLFYKIIKNSRTDILPCPIVGNIKIPQGLAGGSAYLIKPEAAEKIISLVYKYGLWPNDAILCQQLMPEMLGVTKTPYTKVQN